MKNRIALIRQNCIKAIVRNFKESLAPSYRFYSDSRNELIESIGDQLAEQYWTRENELHNEEYEI
jgi:hypothetical protein